MKRFVGAWRWLASSRLQNELRYGANLAPVGFEVVEGVNPTIRFAGQNATLPLTLMNPQIRSSAGPGHEHLPVHRQREPDVGDHALQMGAKWQKVHVNPYNYEDHRAARSRGGSVPPRRASAQLTSAMFPGGISAADLSSANTMLSMLTGTISAGVDPRSR